MRIQKLLGSPSTRAMLVSETVLIITCYVAAVCIIAEADPWVFLLHANGLLRILLLTLVVVGSLYFQDLYDDLRVASGALLVQQICLALGLAYLFQALLNYTDSGLVFPRWVMLLGSSLAIVALPSWRIVFSDSVTSAIHAEKVLFLGYSPLVGELDRRFREKPELGKVGIGFVSTSGTEESALGLRCLGSADRFREVVAEHQPDRIIVAVEERRRSMPLADLLALRFSGVQIEEISAAYELAFDRVCLGKLYPSQLIFSSGLGPNRQVLALQSLYSSILAAMLLALALPVLLLAVALVKLTSRGPAVYQQKRVGKDGKVFTLYKLRSMYIDAESRTGAVWAQKNDPRITPVGRFLRRYRVDEIPQLLNVIKGEMAIVGPRPERPEFVDELAEKIPFYRQRHAVRPGITGWAQIKYKYGDNIEDTMRKLEYDLYYIKHLNPAIDAYVMFHTVKVIVLGRGAQ